MVIARARQADCAERLLGFLKSPFESGKKSLVEKAGEKRKRAEKKKEAAAKKATKKGKGKAAGKGKAGATLKRPPTAFILYCNNKRDKVKGEK